MGVISKETADLIYKVHLEIGEMEQVLEEIEKSQADYKEWAPRRRSGYQLGIPSGSQGHTMYDLSPALLPLVVRSHMENQQKALANACEMARLELAEEM